MSRDCDAFNCPASIAPGRFLCSRHWRMVPVGTQRTINARYRACRADFAFLNDVAYLQACIDAIRGISRAEGNGIDVHANEVSSYDRLLRVAQRKAQA
ncbi:hypothetical protein BH10PSE18_BH10PSE18_18650 [soil metagenome]